ncbi:aromatic ring-hydroxylating dioxygenase subunit alpha [Sphingosinicellaceae bacterium]|nr:aromatic ring-hydroxylating dioxygenase subunit alpha [Sphingosinicellaceae bacterium]
MPQALYNSADAFAFDLQAIFAQSWLFAGFVAEVRGAGDYVSLIIGEYPVLIVRGRDGDVRAFHNSCRHRGSLLCKPGSGTAPRLVCPYHRWTYGLDGKLLAAGRMPDDFVKGEHSLMPVHLETVAGAMFICLAETPPPFDTMRRDLTPLLAPHNLDHAKLAFESTLVEYGNWKLVMENGRECYHCPTGHPELSKTFPTGATAHFEASSEHERAFDARMLSIALPSGPVEEAWWQAVRFPLNNSMTSMTIDGTPSVKRLMCEIGGGDIGSLRWAVEPNSFCHSTGDYTFSFTAMPVGPRETHVVAKWLVHEDAVEGVDYDVASLSDLWTRTNLQDKEFVENNQRGVNSPGYRPGPYSPEAESLTMRFVDWYCTTAQRYLDTHPA